MNKQDNKIDTNNSLTDRNAPWRVELRDGLKAAQRTAIPRVNMPELEPTYRVTVNDEVAQGLTLEQALQESTRCLDCPEPGCMEGCPVSINIPSFIKNIQRRRMDDAVRVLRMTSTLPAVCGRVCPQERQCESKCIYLRMKKPAVAIGWLERYAADHGKVTHTGRTVRDDMPRVAVAGSGPAGLSFAGAMAALGYRVTVFEALHEIGGVLKYGIPEFRLPNPVVDKEIETLREMGVEFMTDVIIGKTISYAKLLDDGFAGMFIASGAGLPRFMGIPGENLNGVMSSNEYLTRINLMGAGRGGDTPVQHGRRVAVIGGGNTAMDSVRTALRMGADEAMIVYRRSEAEMPARLEEVHHARQEGVKFLTLHNPESYVGDDKGRVVAMRLRRMTLGEPDESGRRSPVPVDGPEGLVEVPVDQVIVSVGVSPNPIIPRSLDELEVSRRGTIVVDDELMSSIPAIFAGGDIVRGGATVILAMGDGRRGAEAMHKYLSDKNKD